jgi:hypothetical protein
VLPPPARLSLFRLQGKPAKMGELTDASLDNAPYTYHNIRVKQSTYHKQELSLSVGNEVGSA